MISNRWSIDIICRVAWYFKTKIFKRHIKLHEAIVHQRRITLFTYINLYIKNYSLMMKLREKFYWILLNSSFAIGTCLCCLNRQQLQNECMIDDYSLVHSFLFYIYSPIFSQEMSLIFLYNWIFCGFHKE